VDKNFILVKVGITKGEMSFNFSLSISF
jgi:hypothetical protein